MKARVAANLVRENQASQNKNIRHEHGENEQNDTGLLTPD